MFSLITALILFFPNQETTTYTIHGKVLQDVRSYGGMYREYPEDNARPWHGAKLKVVRFEGKIKAVVVDTVRSDVNGRFSVELPVGTYGFIALDDKPEKNLFLPESTYSSDEMYSRSSSWSANISMPIELRDKDVVGLHLTNRRTSNCRRCP